MPDAGVILDKAGNLYGSATYGGPKNCSGLGCGTIYKLTRGATSWTFSTIHTFNYSDGAYPMGSLIMDSAGNLYGSTNGGGSTYNGELPSSSLQPRPDGTRLCCTSLDRRVTVQNRRRSFWGQPDTCLVRFQSAPMRTSTNKTAMSLNCLTTPTELGVKASYSRPRKPTLLRFLIRMSFGTPQGRLCWAQSDRTLIRPEPYMRSLPRIQLK
jgi:hypothetical protein